MVPILSIYIYRNTHTKTGGKKERLGKQRKEKPKAEKRGKKKQRKGRKPGRGPAVFDCSGSPGSPPPPGAHDVGTKPGSWAGERRGCTRPAELPGVIPGPRATQLTRLHRPVSRPRLTTYFWSIPAGRGPAGRTGRRPRPRAWWQRPLARSALTSTRPCQPPGQAAVRLEPTARPAPPSPAPSHRPRSSALGPAGLRHQVEEGTRPPEAARGTSRGGARGTPGDPSGLR